MIGEASDPAFHAAHPSVPAEVSLDDRFGENAEGVEHGADAEDDDRHREDASALPERVDLLVAHRCHRGQDHEQGVAEVPAQQHHVADHPIAKDQGEDQQRKPKSL